MPDLETLHSEREELKKVKLAAECLKNANLIGVHTSLPEDVSAIWLMARYGIEKVFMIISCWKSLPVSLTNFQLTKYLSNFCSLSEEEAGELVKFVDTCCPSLLEALVLKRSLPVVLAPPVSECIECGTKLVLNHSCQIKYYTEEEAAHGDKVTLRCIGCKLTYNITQYGDKSKNGFWFYPTVGEVVEAKDTVYAKRSLLRFQCALA